jgi:HAE1 family hydrophobic/amphiphilic exporter-1
LSGFSASKGYPIEFTLKGPDWGRLQSFADQLQLALLQTGFLQDLNRDYQEGMPQVQIIPYPDKIAVNQLTMNAVGQEVGNMIGGQIFTSSTQYPLSGHRYDIRLRSVPEAHSKIEDIENILIHNNLGVAGEMIALKDVAQVKLVKAPQLITRLNRERSIPMFANVVNGKSQQEALFAVESLSKKILPEKEGYHILVTGGAQAFKEAFSSLIFALVLGVAVAYMVLASQFNSFIQPVTILLSLPFSLTGAFLGLYLTNQSLSIYSMIGLVLLLGIVKKNSILLVDFTNQQRALGLSVKDALLHACPIRLRPILMTSIATIAGAVPEALSPGAGSETRIPMAVALIGGVFLSTLLTLVVVPCMYSFLSHWEKREQHELE